MQAEAYFEESPVCPFVSHGRGINAEPVVLNFFLCLVEGEIAYANLVVKIVFDLILIPSTTVRNRRIVGFRPQIPRVFRIAAEFERNQMVLFVVPRVCICVGIFLYLFSLESVRVIHWRTYGLGGPVGIADVLVNIVRRDVWICGSRRSDGVGVNVWRSDARLYCRSL